MKKQQKVSLFLFTILIIIIGACGRDNKQKEQVMNEPETDLIFPKGERLPNENFTGLAYLHPLLAKDKNNDFALGSVTFEAGARTVWHSHPKGQVLLVIEGAGIYQEKGKPARLLRKGDVVNCPENITHWHGASEQNRMTHIAITNYKDDENVVWGTPVTKDEYEIANRN